MSGFKLNSPRDETGYDISVSDDKYRFRFGPNTGHRIVVQRHSESWIEIRKGSNAIIALLDVIERLETARLHAIAVLEEIQSKSAFDAEHHRLISELAHRLHQVQED